MVVLNGFNKYGNKYSPKFLITGTNMKNMWPAVGEFQNQTPFVRLGIWGAGLANLGAESSKLTNMLLVFVPDLVNSVRDFASLKL